MTEFCPSLSDHAFDEAPDESPPSRELSASALAPVASGANKAQLKALVAELTQLNKELFERNSQIEEELYTTRQLQQSLLPAFLDLPGFDGLARCHYMDAHVRVSGLYMPCDSVGGDLYDVVTVNDNEVGVALADVSGHGVPASFITAMFKASFYRTTHHYDLPGDVLFHLNNELMDMVKTGDYITALYCRLLQKGTVLEYAGAGHPHPLHYQAKTGIITPLKENGTPLIWFKDMDYPTGSVNLATGDIVLAYTDGVTEMYDADKNLFGDERLHKIFAEAITNAKEVPILDYLIGCLSDFTQGHPLMDDLSMVLIERL
jgi:phosphoserine phosphatase RsbU/P